VTTQLTKKIEIFIVHCLLKKTNLKSTYGVINESYHKLVLVQ